MESQQLRRGQAVRVCWVDSSSEPGWRYDKNAGGVNRVVSLGFVVNSKPDCLTLTSSLDSSGGTLDPVGIPWPAITDLLQISDFNNE